MKPSEIRTALRELNQVDAAIAAVAPELNANQARRRQLVAQLIDHLHTVPDQQLTIGTDGRRYRLSLIEGRGTVSYKQELLKHITPAELADIVAGQPATFKLDLTTL